MISFKYYLLQLKYSFGIKLKILSLLSNESLKYSFELASRPRSRPYIYFTKANKKQ